MPPTILIVENHNLLREALRDWLKEIFPRSHLIEAANGKEAIALAQTESPHLVVTVFNLPGFNGFEMTRQIKAVFPLVKIVIVSSHDDDIYRASAKAVGASAYVPKQALRTELIPALDTLLTNIQD